MCVCLCLCVSVPGSASCSLNLKPLSLPHVYNREPAVAVLGFTPKRKSRHKVKGVNDEAQLLGSQLWRGSHAFSDSMG